MQYCPANVTFYTVWYDKGFSPCFVDTVIAFLLGTMMFIFGNAELWMYNRYGSRISDQLAGRTPRLYLLQLSLIVLLLLVPFVWLVLRCSYGLPFYGYAILYNVTFLYNWTLCLVLLYFERYYDLPSLPARGHSMTLNIFWASSFALESLIFVNFNGEKWFFIVENTEDRLLLCTFIVRWLLLMAILVLGLIAPGVVSSIARGQFEYKRLSESALQYGSSQMTEAASSSVDQQSEKKRAKEELNAYRLLSQFQQLSRQTPSLSFSVARTRENRCRNRYTNVVPYDYNRVVLNGGRSVDSDYINASFVTVRIPEVDEELRYIASQGPLQSTVGHFWQMIWEQKIHTIVMLTELSETGMEKCCKYWPDLDKSEEHGKLLVSCIRSKQGSRFEMREFSVIHVDSQHELSVSQVCFTAWPDHGVPTKQHIFQEFIQLVMEVKPENVLLYSSSTSIVSQDFGKTPPTLVHCSAGTGRTGVFILVSALMRMIDSNLPLRPVEMVKCLRNQRMGMVQTDEQFIFACDNALSYADRKIAKA